MAFSDTISRSDSAASGDGSPALRVVTPAADARGHARRSTRLRAGAYLLMFAAGAAAVVAYQSARRSPVEFRDSNVAAAAQPKQTVTVPAPEPAAALPTADNIAKEPLRPFVPREPIELASNDKPTIAVEPAAAVEAAPVAEPSTELRVAGVTEPAPGRFARLPLATSQAVAFVDVKPGDRVKKGWQAFSHWESPDRLQAEKIELAKMKKLLEVTRSHAEAAQQTASRLRRLKGDVTAQELQDVDLTARIRQQELEAEELSLSEAESRYAAMEFEFKQAFVTSPIDGRVASVDVVLGERRQLGGAFRGVTVLDTRVLYCRCLLNPEQLALVTRSMDTVNPTPSTTDDRKSANDSSAASSSRLRASVESAGKQWAAIIATVGIQADGATGMIPLLVEVQNPDESLRCGVRVDVLLTELPEERAP